MSARVIIPRGLERSINTHTEGECVCVDMLGFVLQRRPDQSVMTVQIQILKGGFGGLLITLRDHWGFYSDVEPEKFIECNVVLFRG